MTDPMAVPDQFPHKARMADAFGQFRDAMDGVLDALGKMEGRIQASMVDCSEAEICYMELWLRQVRERFKEVDSRVGSVRQMNWKRALHQWYGKETSPKMYGHTFRLDFHVIPSLPKENTKERRELMDWLRAGGRHDCLVMDEGSGEYVFDFNKLEQLVNQMLSEGNRPPACIKLHPQPKLVVRADK